MKDETSIKTQVDVLDLIISFLMSHEKRMDQIIQRLERLVETASRRDYYLEDEQTHRVPPRQQKTFTLTIANPVGFNEMKSLKVEWGSKDGEPANEDQSLILKKMEHTI